MKNWYLVYSKVRQEQVACDNLVRQGYEIYFPRIKNQRTRNRKRISVVEPMFPRYLFIALSELSDNWAPICSTFGVSELVRFGGHAARLPDGLIDLLKTQEDENGVHKAAYNELKIGDKVRVIDGPVRHYEGIIIAKNSRSRVELLLNTVAGYTTKVQLSDECIERID